MHNVLPALISKSFSLSKKVFFSMKRETRRAIKELAYFSSIGLSVALSIFIGLAIGVYLDRRVFNTTPWFTLIFLGLGIIAGFRNIGIAIKKSRKLYHGVRIYTLRYENSPIYYALWFDFDCLPG